MNDYGLTPFRQYCGHLKMEPVLIDIRQDKLRILDVIYIVIFDG